MIVLFSLPGFASISFLALRTEKLLQFHKIKLFWHKKRRIFNFAEFSFFLLFAKQTGWFFRRKDTLKENDGKAWKLMTESNVEEWNWIFPSTLRTSGAHNELLSASLSNEMLLTQTTLWLDRGMSNFQVNVFYCSSSNFISFVSRTWASLSFFDIVYSVSSKPFLISSKKLTIIIIRALFNAFFY